jgi:Transposase DDE domain
MINILNKDKSKLAQLGKSQLFILTQIECFLKPYTNSLYTKMDIRLVRTFSDAFTAILTNRHRENCLILSELGAFIAGFKEAVKGTKRLSNLFRSLFWSHEDIEEIQLLEAQKLVSAWQKEGRRVLGMMDDSTIEKPESWFSEGLCAVHSSKAQRLTRVKRGYYHPPLSRLCVPGFEWSALMIGGLRLIPTMGLMKWWTKRGKHSDSRDNVFYKMLKQIKSTFGTALTLVLDRGFANLPTLERLFKCEQFFIIRWKSSNLLNDIGGSTKNTWRMCHGKKAFDKRLVWDKERKQTLKIELIYAPVWHPDCLDKPLYLIVVRNKTMKGQAPMYLLTNVEVETVGLAWEIFFSYVQRWDIEQTFRFNKSELGIQSIRLWAFENRLKMLALVTLVYQFLLNLWRNRQATVSLIMRTWCPRTDNRLNKARLPLYRLRLALFAVLLVAFIAAFHFKDTNHPELVLLQSSG